MVKARRIHMNKGLLTAAALLTSAGLGLTQEVIQTPPRATQGSGAIVIPGDGRLTPVPDLGHGPVVPSGPAATNCPRVWASAEYLLWWLKDAPLGAPIATRGSLTDAFPGALGQPGTHVISPGRLDFAPFSGSRITLGGWLNDDRTIGIEGSGFLLESASARYFTGGATGSPPIFVPFFNPDVTSFGGIGERAFPFGAIGSTSGTVTATNRTRLWGSEINGLFNLANEDSFTLTLLGGFRYLDLEESLGIDLLGNFPPPPPLFLLTHDRFGTRNQFYGGQAGARGEMRMGNFFVSLTGKVALGDMVEHVTATGVAIQPPVTVRGGFFVQNSNFGRRGSDEFAVIPQVSGQVGMDVTENIRVHIGYDFLYISDVVRPGDQFDRRVNFSQQAAPVGAGALIGPALPASQFNHSDFWAHGINFGVTLRF
jgi:hypothetical protein